MHPVLFHLGPLPIYTYGFCVGLGVLLAVFLMRRQSAREKWTHEEVLDLAVFFTLASFIGARLFYVIQHGDYFMGRPMEVFKVWEGGIVFYGGAIGALLFLLFYTQKKNWFYLKVTDFLAPYVFLAHAFGRIGCFLNGCCYGRITDLPWAVQYPFLPDPVHPVQIYSAVFDFIAFIFLLCVHARKKYDGQTTLAYFLIYGAGRFLLEDFRGDNPSFLMELTLPQLVSVAFVLLASLSYFLYFRKIHECKRN